MSRSVISCDEAATGVNRADAVLLGGLGQSQLATFVHSVFSLQYPLIGWQMEYDGIKREDWSLSPRFSRHIDSQAFNGVPFTTILETAMALVDISMRNGTLVSEAEALTNAHTPWGFGRLEMKSILRGRLNWKKYPRKPNLQFWYPDEAIARRALGAAILGYNWGDVAKIDINHRAHVRVANADPRVFPQNQEGVRTLAVFVGATVLHELMHVEGFEHVATSSNRPSHPYNRSLPEVAGQAFANIHLNNFVFLHGQQATPIRRCSQETSVEVIGPGGGIIPER